MMDNKHDIAHRATQDMRGLLGQFSGKIIHISKDETMRNPNWAQDVVYLQLSNISQVLEREIRQATIKAYNAGAQAVLSDIEGTRNAASLEKNYRTEDEYTKHAQAVSMVVERLVL